MSGQCAPCLVRSGWPPERFAVSLLAALMVSPERLSQLLEALCIEHRKQARAEAEKLMVAIDREWQAPWRR